MGIWISSQSTGIVQRICGWVLCRKLVQGEVQECGHAGGSNKSRNYECGTNGMYFFAHPFLHECLANFFCFSIHCPLSPFLPADVPVFSLVPLPTKVLSPCLVQTLPPISGVSKRVPPSPDLSLFSTHWTNARVPPLTTSLNQQNVHGHPMATLQLSQRVPGASLLLRENPLADYNID